jgi:hypothetical protein
MGRRLRNSQAAWRIVLFARSQHAELPASRSADLARDGSGESNGLQCRTTPRTNGRDGRRF